MRKPNAKQIALIAGSVIAIGVQVGKVHAVENLPPVNVPGYYDVIIVLPGDISGSGPSTPASGSGPGGVTSANPNSHVNCTANYLAAQFRDIGDSQPSDPSNTSEPIPERLANPIDITAGSHFTEGSIGSQNGFAIFPNIYTGIYNAWQSEAYYNEQYYTVWSLINTWAPVSQNPNAMNNTLSGLGMSTATAQATHLSSLTAGQIMQVISAFAWQEGFKPSGC